MADPLNLISSAIPRFMPALLVLVVVYAMMLSSGKLGKNQFINSIVAFALAAMVLVSENVSRLIGFISPWFVVLFVFVLFMLIAFKSTGVTDSMILDVIKSRNYIAWTIAFIAIGILLYGVSQMFGQDLLTGESPASQVSGQSQNNEIVDFMDDGTPIYTTTLTSTDDFDTNLNNTLFHPSILGLALIGLIATFTVFFMTK